MAVIIFLAIVLPINGQEKSAHPGSDQRETRGHEKPSESPRTAECTIENDATTIKCNWAEAKPEGYLKRLFSPENAPNIGLFFVGLAGVVAAFCTLRKIERQTQAAENVLIATQRPKLVVKRASLIPGKFVMVNGKRIVQDDIDWQIACEIANLGASKAMIIESDLTISNLGVGELQELLPGLPAYGKDYSFGEFSIESGERQERFIVLKPSDTGRFRTLYAMFESGMHTSTSPLIYFGFFRYQDLSGVRRLTGFGSQWNPEDMSSARLSGTEYEYED